MSRILNVAEAKARLSELIAAAEAGEDVVISRAGKPAVRIVPITTRKVVLGSLSDRVPPGSAPDFLEPMTNEELEDWGA